MKRIVSFILLVTATLLLQAKGFSWVCAVEWSEDKPEWVFVYEDVKLQSDGTYRVFVKWDFPEDTIKSHAKQTWILSADFDRMCIIEATGYNKKGEVTYFQNYPYGRDWNYVLPDTYAEAIVGTAKEILIKKGW